MNNIRVYYDYDSNFIELGKSSHNAKFQYSKLDNNVKFFIEASARPDVIINLMDTFESIKDRVSSINIGDFKIVKFDNSDNSLSVDIFMSNDRTETTEYMKNDVWPIMNINFYMTKTI